MATQTTHPTSWKKISLEKECWFERGIEPGAEAYNTEGIGERFIRVVDVTESRNNHVFVNGLLTSKRVKQEDILLTLDGTIGAVRKGLEGIYSTGVRKVSFRNGEYSNKLLYFLLQDNNVQRTIDLYASGSTIRHASSAIPQLFVHVPQDFEEQEKIAEILTTIDQTIEKTDLLIKKYESIRTGMMQDFFFYEIKNGKLSREKANWKIVPLGEFATVSNGTTPSMTRKDYWENGTIPWLSSGKINDYTITTPSEYVTKRALKETSLKLFPVGTVLVAMVGQGKTRGMSARLEFESTINQNLAAIIPSPQLDAKFLHYYLDYHYEDLRGVGRGSNQDALTCTLISEYTIPLPPIDEQRNISVRISQIEEQINNEKQYKNKMEMLKNGLMEDLLTGTVSVVH